MAPDLPSSDTTDGDVVHLSLPADGPCAAAARAATRAMGLRAGFGRGVLEPLALAVDEALVLVLPTTDDGVDLDLSAAPGNLAITVRSRHAQRPLDADATARFRTLAATLVGTAVMLGDGEPADAPGAGPVGAAPLEARVVGVRLEVVADAGSLPGA